MTREEAARILDPETSIETFHEYANYRKIAAETVKNRVGRWSTGCWLKWCMRGGTDPILAGFSRLKSKIRIAIALTAHNR